MISMSRRRWLLKPCPGLIRCSFMTHIGPKPNGLDSSDENECWLSSQPKSATLRSLERFNVIMRCLASDSCVPSDLQDLRQSLIEQRRATTPSELATSSFAV